MKNFVLMTVAVFPMTVVVGWIYQSTWQELPQTLQAEVFAGGGDQFLLLLVYLFLCGLATVTTAASYRFLNGRMIGFRSSTILFLVSWIASVMIVLNPHVFSVVFSGVYGG